MLLNVLVSLRIFTSLAKANPPGHTLNLRPPPTFISELPSSSKNVKVRSKGRRSPGINISELCESLLSGSQPR